MGPWPGFMAPGVWRGIGPRARALANPARRSRQEADALTRPATRSSSIDQLCARAVSGLDDISRLRRTGQIRGSITRTR